MSRAVTIAETEAVPSAYPDAPSGLSTAAAALDSDAIWQRIEAWVSVRWTARAVVCHAEGPGEFMPRLRFFTISATEVWNGSAYAAAALAASPLGGLCLPGEGPYRISGTAGDDSTPPT